jgi:hypothetical protein
MVDFLTLMVSVKYGCGSRRNDGFGKALISIPMDCRVHEFADHRAVFCSVWMDLVVLSFHWTYQLIVFSNYLNCSLISSPCWW